MVAITFHVRGTQRHFLSLSLWYIRLSSLVLSYCPLSFRTDLRPPFPSVFDRTDKSSRTSLRLAVYFSRAQWSGVMYVTVVLGVVAIMSVVNIVVIVIVVANVAVLDIVVIVVVHVVRGRVLQRQVSARARFRRSSPPHNDSRNDDNNDNSSNDSNPNDNDDDD